MDQKKMESWIKAINEILEKGDLTGRNEMIELKAELERILELVKRRDRVA